MKKSFFILSFMATTMLGANAWADTCTPRSDTNCGSNCSYTLDANCQLTINPIDSANEVTINANAFVWSPATSVVFNGNITSIGNSAFAYSHLTSVTIPDSVTSMTNSAFGYATQLTSVVIGNGLSTIEGYVFTSIPTLTSVTIPNSVTTISYGAFDGATGLTSITIPNSVTSIYDNAFNGTGLTSLVIPDSVTSIGRYICSNAANLTSLVIEGTPSIGFDAFIGMPENSSVYCLTGHTQCENKGHAITYYDKDENGVYSLTKDGQTYYYSSADKMMAGGVEDGCTSPAACAAVIAAATAQQGTGAGSATGTGSSTGSGKRIYTVEEARQAVEAAGTETVNFRIRYK